MFAYTHTQCLPCNCTPQVFLNYRRQSTEGWNVHNVLLDFGGGLLSLVQVGGVASGAEAMGGRWELCGSGQQHGTVSTPPAGSKPHLNPNPNPTIRLLCSC